VRNAISALLLAEGAAVMVNQTTGLVAGGVVEIGRIQAASGGAAMRGRAGYQPTDISSAIGQLPSSVPPPGLTNVASANYAG